MLIVSADFDVLAKQVPVLYFCVFHQSVYMYLVCVSFQAEKGKWQKALKNSEEVNLLL